MSEGERDQADVHETVEAILDRAGPQPVLLFGPLMWLGKNAEDELTRGFLLAASAPDKPAKFATYSFIYLYSEGITDEEIAEERMKVMGTVWAATIRREVGGQSHDLDDPLLFARWLEGAWPGEAAASFRAQIEGQLGQEC